MNKLSKASIGRISLIVTTLIWGSSFVILKNALDSITPFWVIAIRFVGAGLLLLLLCLPKLKSIERGYFAGGAVMGVCLSAAYCIQTYGLMYTSPGKNAFLTATYCVLVPFLYWLIARKKPDKYNIIAAFVCLVGIGFVCLGDDFSVNKGDLLTVCCGLFYGLHIILTARYVEGRNPMILTAFQFIAGGIVTLALALLFEPAPSDIPAQSWVSIAYMTFVCTGLCFLLQTLGQKYTPPSQAAVILTLESVFGTMFSLLLGEEKLTLAVAVGFTIIFAAVLTSETKLEFLRRRHGKTARRKNDDRKA